MVPEGTPEVQLGQVYQLGHHRVMCGDGTDPVQVARLMGEAKADFIFTDPRTTSTIPACATPQRWQKLANDALPPEKFQEFLEGLFRRTATSSPPTPPRHMCATPT